MAGSYTLQPFSQAFLTSKRKPPSPAPLPRRKASSASAKLGVWIFGALGGLATTLVTGARAMAKGSE